MNYIKALRKIRRARNRGIITPKVARLESLTAIKRALPRLTYSQALRLAC